MPQAYISSEIRLLVRERAMAACEYLLNLTPPERLRKAGVLSGDFWLTK